MEARATILETIPAMGRTQQHLACPCGATFWRFVWSWAGHGYTRCPTCRGYILYFPFLVYVRTREEAIQTAQEGRTERRTQLLRHITKET